jgi:hypothetical protein
MGRYGGEDGRAGRWGWLLGRGCSMAVGKQVGR